LLMVLEKLLVNIFIISKQKSPNKSGL